MKTRNGFVSNSSSTSFTCDVCGEEQSGMDLSRSDAGMQECTNGHTFCDSHELSYEVSEGDMRKALITSAEKYRNAKWKKPGEVDAEIATINAKSLDELQEDFDDYCSDAGCVPDKCPICQMQNVSDGDAVRYALIKLGFKDRKELAAAWRTEFGTYDKLQEWIKQNQKTETKA